MAEAARAGAMGARAPRRRHATARAALLVSALAAALGGARAVPVAPERPVPAARPWVESHETCDRHRDKEYREFCKAMFPHPNTRKKQRLAIERAMASCDFRRYVGGAPPVRVSDGPMLTLPGSYRRSKGPHWKEWCVTTIDPSNGTTAGTEGDWVFVRVGPITTTGGYSWTEATFRVLHPLLGPLPRITGSYLGSTSASLQLLDFPPLHQHHFHLVQNGTHVTAHEIIAHGDSACKDAEGGAACHIRLYPEGYAHQMAMPMTAWAEVNDVRPAGSAPLEHWFTVGVRFLREQEEWRAPHSLTLFCIGHTGTNKHEEKGYANTFVVPGDRKSYAWSAGSFPPIGGRALWAWWHNHLQWTEQVAVFVGVTPAQLGLLSGHPLHHEIMLGDGRLWYERLVQRALLLGASMCEMKRDDSPVDEHGGTSELGTHFYRLYSSCTSWSLSYDDFTPVVWIGRFSPESDAVATKHALLHSLVRVLVTSPVYNRPSSTLKQGPVWPPGYKAPMIPRPEWYEGLNITRNPNGPRVGDALPSLARREVWRRGFTGPTHGHPNRVRAYAGGDFQQYIS